MKFTAKVLVLLALFSSNVPTSSAQTWDWVNSYLAPNLHGSFFDNLVSDNEGNIIAVGSISDSIEFHTDTLGDDYWNLPSPAFGNMVVAKFDQTTGTEQWVKSFEGYGYSTIFDVVTDDQLNIYCAGYFWDSLYLDNDTLISGGSADAVLIKLSPTGQVLWHRQFKGLAGFIQGNGIEITENGTVVMIADYEQSFTVDGTVIPPVDQAFFVNLFIGGFHQNGDLLWHHTYPGAGPNSTTSGLDIRGDKMAICGDFRGTLKLGSFQYSPNTDMEWDVFTAQLDTLGNVDWVQPVNSNWNESVGDVEIDANYDVISVGYFSDTIDFGGLTTPLEQEWPVTTYAEGGGSFVVKYNAAGIAQWSKTRPGNSYGHFFGVDSDDAGNLYMSGFFQGQDSIAGTYIESWGISRQYFICAMDPFGNEQWIAWNYPGNGLSRGIIYKDNAVYAVGDCYCLTEFGPFNFTDPYNDCSTHPTITKVINDVVSINEGEMSSLSIYPNPVTDQIQISLNSYETLTYTVFDVNGRILIEGEGNTIDVSKLASGAYWIQCLAGNESTGQKFTKL